jgi:hypothetical protein
MGNRIAESFKPILAGLAKAAEDQELRSSV